MEDDKREKKEKVWGLSGPSRVNRYLGDPIEDNMGNGSLDQRLAQVREVNVERHPTCSDSSKIFDNAPDLKVKQS